jgi:hypothetical protein
LVSEMSLRVSTRSAPCRVVRVSAGQRVARFIWRFCHQPGRVFRDISLPAEHSPRRSIFVVVPEFACDLLLLRSFQVRRNRCLKVSAGAIVARAVPLAICWGRDGPVRHPTGRTGLGRRSWSLWLRWRGRAPHPWRCYRQGGSPCGCSGAATPADPHTITVSLQSRESERQRRIRRRSGRAADAANNLRAFDALPGRQVVAAPESGSSWSARGAKRLPGCVLRLRWRRSL